ncbi:MAG TPA: sigma factor [Enhygromyxa sp.]|nr:sigma factor [Enhygromyxa sp.]
MSLDDRLAAARAEDSQLRSGLAVDDFWAAVLDELYRYFASRFTRADADDLVQQSLDVVLRKIQSYQRTGPDSFARWLQAIAHNKALAQREQPQRERARIDVLCGQPRPSPLFSPHSWVLLHERSALLEQHKHELPDHERRALEHELRGEEDRLLAEREGVALATVRTRRRRARRRVAGSIAEERRTPS